jgi:flagellar basal-body rod protein FlgB
MQTSLDSYLGIHAQALTLEAKRNEMLAANLANVDTPNYKARDLDFKAALAAASGPSTASGAAGGASGGAASIALRPGNASAQAAGAAGSTTTGDSSIEATSVKYRVPMAPSLDGNTVDEQLEQSAFAENSVRYQATLTFLNNALRGLMTAITGS